MEGIARYANPIEIPQALKSTARFTQMQHEAMQRLGIEDHSASTSAH